MLDHLMAYYSPDPNSPERVGFVLKDGAVVEVENVCSDPVNGFEVKGEDIIRYEDTASATWHTHPGDAFDSNLTVADLNSYLAWPGLKHHIVGKDGVTTYVVEGNKVLIASQDSFTRITENNSRRPD